jgi:ABC-type nitrate/sulfonate/bicarbonate transport system substrate-binding protein
VGQGTVAAAVIGDPWATRLLAAGAVALVDLRQPDAARRWLGGPTVHAAVFVPGRSAFQAGQLQPFVRAVARAIRRIEDTSPDELAIGLPTSVVGLPDDFAERVAGARALYLSDGLVDAERLARSLALVRDRWPIPVALKLPKNAADLLLGDRR